MPRQSNGTYQQPANTAAVSDQTISSTAYNTLITDIGTELTNSLDRGGRSAMTAALPMGSNKITGMADPTVSTDGATKNYVDTTTAAFFSTGDIKPTFKTAPDTGWIMMDDGTFGSASSGSSNRANADTQNLFNLFFNNMTDANAPLLTSGGAATTRAAQTNAATAWAANCRMMLPKSASRLFGNANNGVNGTTLSTRTLGQSVGAETQQLGVSNLPAYTPSGSITNGAISFGNVIFSSVANGGQNAIATSSTGSAGGNLTSALSPSQATSSFAGTPQGGTSAPFSIIPPAMFCNWMCKL